MCVSGILGIVAAREHTITSIYAFVILSFTGALFSFYLVISAAIPVSKYADLGSPASVSNVIYL
jgi:hypothetical protein